MKNNTAVTDSFSKEVYLYTYGTWGYVTMQSLEDPSVEFKTTWNAINASYPMGTNVTKQDAIDEANSLILDALYA